MFKKKKKKSSVASAALSVSLSEQRSNAEPGIAKPVALFHHSQRIDNLPQVPHLKIASNMVSSEVSIIV